MITTAMMIFANRLGFMAGLWNWGEGMSIMGVVRDGAMASSSPAKYSYDNYGNWITRYAEDRSQDVPSSACSQ